VNRRQFLVTSTAASLAASLSPAQEATAKLRVAVIGHTGRGNYGHQLDTLWLQVPEVEIVGVADADPKGLEEAQKRLNLPKGHADYRQMLAETKPDIVSVAPRFIDEHYDMVLAAIDAGAKGIYMEKPFCRNLAEADGILAACKAKDVKLALAHRNRYHPVLPVIAKLLDEGQIGRVLEFRGRGKEDQRGGALDLWVLGSHVFNVLCFFAGQPSTCSATVLLNGLPVGKNDVKEGGEGVGPLAGNEIHARFGMKNGLMFYFDTLQNAGEAEAGFGLQIIGTQGIIDLRMDEEPLAHVLMGSPFDPVKEPRTWQTITTGGIGVPEPRADIKSVGDHMFAVADLLASIKENRQPLCSAADGLTTVEMISAIFESHRQNAQRVNFPLQTRVNPLTLL